MHEKNRWEIHKNAFCCFEQTTKATPQKHLLYSHLNLISKTIHDKQNMQVTARKVCRIISFLIDAYKWTVADQFKYT